MWKVIASVAVFIGCISMTGGRKCLQCLDTDEDGPCVHDYKGLVGASQGDFTNGSQYYHKQCPDGTHNGVQHDFCVIEQFIVGGKLKSFIRDCSDGQNFSFTGTVQNPKLESVVPDNYTTCVFIISANAHICLTLCDEDFCNAPLPPNETCYNDTGHNVSCGAGRLSSFPFASGPFGPIVDRVLGRGYLVPLLVAILGVLIFG